MKYRYFLVYTADKVYKVTAPQNKVTVNYALLCAKHWVKKQHGQDVDVVKVEVIKNVNES